MTAETGSSRPSIPLPKPSRLAELSSEKGEAWRDLATSLSRQLKKLDNKKTLQTPQQKQLEEEYLGKPEDPDLLWDRLHRLYQDNKEAAETAYLIIRSAQIMAQGGTIPPGKNAETIHQDMVNNPTLRECLTEKEGFNSRQILIGPGAVLKLLNDLIPTETAEPPVTPAAKDRGRLSLGISRVGELIRSFRPKQKEHEPEEPEPKEPTDFEEFSRLLDRYYKLDKQRQKLKPGTQYDKIEAEYKRLDDLLGRVADKHPDWAARGAEMHGVSLITPQPSDQQKGPEELPGEEKAATETEQPAGITEEVPDQPILSEEEKARQEILETYQTRAEELGIKMPEGDFMPADGAQYTTWADEEKIYVVSSHVDPEEIEKRLEQMGHCGSNDGAITFVGPDGRYWVGPGSDKNYQALEKAGYNWRSPEGKYGRIGNIMNNNCNFIDLDLEDRWNSLCAIADAEKAATEKIESTTPVTEGTEKEAIEQTAKLLTALDERENSAPASQARNNQQFVETLKQFNRVLRLTGAEAAEEIEAELAKQIQLPQLLLDYDYLLPHPLDISSNLDRSLYLQLFLSAFSGQMGDDFTAYHTGLRKLMDQLKKSGQGVSNEQTDDLRSSMSNRIADSLADGFDRYCKDRINKSAIDLQVEIDQRKFAWEQTTSALRKAISTGVDLATLSINAIEHNHAYLAYYRAKNILLEQERAFQAGIAQRAGLSIRPDIFQNPRGAYLALARPEGETREEISHLFQQAEEALKANPDQEES